MPLTSNYEEMLSRVFVKKCTHTETELHHLSNQLRKVVLLHILLAWLFPMTSLTFDMLVIIPVHSSEMFVLHDDVTPLLLDGVLRFLWGTLFDL